MPLVTVAHDRFLRDLGLRLRVLVDGVDVTAGCFVADDRHGYAGVVVRDLFTGRLEMTVRADGSRTARREILTGRVQVLVEPDDPAPAAAAQGGLFG